jgi:hypothetical protein
LGPQFEIIRIELLSDNRISLTWSSKADQFYTVSYSEDGSDFLGDAGDAFESQGETTTHIIDNPTVEGDPPAPSPAVLFRILENE